MADDSGFYYDPGTGRYFRELPPHLSNIKDSLPSRDLPTAEASDLLEQSAPRTRRRYGGELVPKTLFRLTAHISRFLDPFNVLQYTLPQSVLCSSRRFELEAYMSGASIPLTPEASAVLGAPRKVTDMTLNRSGDLVISSTRLPSSDSALFFVSELAFNKAEKKVDVRPITLELCQTFTMLGPEIGISANEQSEIVLHYEALRKSGFVLARTYRPGRDGVVAQETLSSRWYKTEPARWPMPLHIRKIPLAEGLTCTPFLTGGTIGALSTLKGEIHVLGMYNISDMESTHTLCSPDESSVLSMAFREHELILYAGTRSGTVLTWDLRTESLDPTSIMNIESSSSVVPSVIQLHVIDNDYLVANCLDSKLLLWDLRMNRQVLSYSEHINSHHACRSVVDKSQSVVVAVGDDKSIRVWSLWEGTMLRCIPEMRYSDGLLVGELPGIAYTNSLGGPSGPPALLVATHEGFTPLSL
jgi:hypothetical protein